MRHVNARDSLALVKFKAKAKELKNQGVPQKNVLPPLQNRDPANETKWRVKSLPLEWVPNTKPSKNLNKYIAQKAAQHEKYIDEMRIKIAELNESLESRIRAEAQSVTKCFPNMRDSILDILQKIDCSIKGITLTSADYDQVESEIDMKTSDCADIIATYYNRLLELEQQRSCGIKVILRESFEAMNTLSYKLPYELQTFFENEIMNMNQITLSNFRCYEELLLALNLKLENDKRLWLERFQFQKNNYIHRSLQIEKKGEDTDVDVMDPADIKAGVLVDKNGLKITLSGIKTFARTITESLIKFDVETKALKNTLQVAIEKILNGNYDEVQNIKIDLNQNVKSDYYFDDLYEMVYNSFFEMDAGLFIQEFTLEVKDKWAVELEKLTAEFEKGFNFFNTALHIWDRHFERIFELKEVFLLDFRNVAMMHTGNKNNEYVKLNAIIDQLREASTEKQMTELLFNINKCLDNIFDLAKSNFEQESNFFQKYKQIVDEEGKLWLFEMSGFLKKHEKNKDVDPATMRTRLSRTEVIKEDKEPVFIIVDKLITGLNNWLFGLRETINTATETSQMIFAREADKWIRLNCQQQEKKHLVEVESTKPKFERIYVDVYNMRKAELKQHTQRLKEHIKGIEASLNGLRKRHNDCQSTCYEYCKTYDTAVEKLCEQAQEAKCSVRIHTIETQMQFERSLLSKHLDAIRREHEDVVDTQIEKLKASNMLYIKHIKLFNEGGNYNIEELKLYKMELGKLEKRLKKETAAIKKEVNITYVKLNSSIDQEDKSVTDYLQRSNSEFEFHESVKQKISNVRANIKQETYELKHKFKIAEHTFAKLKRLADEEPGVLKYLDTFTENCEYMNAMFMDVRQLLLQKCTFKLNVTIFKNDGYGNLALNSKTLKRNFVELSANPETDFNVVLFGGVPLGEDYISKVVVILQTSITDIQTVGKNFYATLTDIINANLNPKDYSDFIVDVIAKYLYYQLQCEEVWLEVAVDYVLLVNNVLRYIQNFYINSVETFLLNKVVEFRYKCKNFANELGRKNRNFDRNYAKIHGKLKALHGHPSNKALLDELCVEMDELNENSKVVQDEMLRSYEEIQNEIEANLWDFQKEILKIELQLKGNIEQYNSFIIEDAKFLNQIEERISYLQTIINSEHSLKSKDDDYIYLIDELNDRVKTLKTRLSITTQSLSNFTSNLSECISKKSNDSDNCSYHTSIQGGSLINIGDMIMLYRKRQESCLSYLESITNLTSIAEKWNEYWLHDLQTLKEIYTVRYNSQRLLEYNEK